jgi:SAM-dependent methyltransferase
MRLRLPLKKIFPFRIERLKKGVVYKNRFDYQKEYVNFNIETGDKVLDLGSGNYPFPLATHLVDLFVGNNFHRGGEKLVRDGRPFVVGNIESLPFRDKEFDFVYCSHVLEHVDNPKKACREIIRIGKRGYIETPTRLSDMIFNFSYLHRWHVNMARKTLVFIEYSNRERRGTGSSYFFERQMDIYDNQVKDIINKNRDIFCNMLLWEESFEFHVFDSNGKLI